MARYALAAVSAAIVVAVAGCGASSPGPTQAPTSVAASPSPSSTLFDNDPTRFGPDVVRYAAEAAIDPQLLMAILYNESYKPHDPEFERSWLKLNPGASLGIANMHEAAFDDTKKGRAFSDRDWHELSDDPDLAIRAAAWYLHDLATRLPATWAAPYTKDELLALGYNAGPSSMLEFADGAQPGPVAQAYLDKFHDNWANAGSAVQK
jgi:transglycosylase-like protein with SLT domain